MVAFFYIAFPFLVLWAISRLLFGQIKARSILFWAVVLIAMYGFCFLCGLFFSFWFEPESYWQTMHFDTSYYDTNAFPDGASLAHVLKVPYIAAVQIAMISFYVLSTHFNWSFAVAYGCGIFTLFNWLRAFYSCYKMRDPTYGF